MKGDKLLFPLYFFFFSLWNNKLSGIEAFEKG